MPYLIMIVWLIVSGICLIAEIFTAGFLLFLPGIGAFLAAIFAYFGLSIYAQSIVFVVSTALMVIFIRPIVTKVFKTDTVKTNTSAVVGKTGIVLRELSKNKRGQVKVDTEIWTAIGTSDDILSKDTLTTVIGIDGVKLIVKEIK